MYYTCRYSNNPKINSQNVIVFVTPNEQIVIGKQHDSSCYEPVLNNTNSYVNHVNTIICNILSKNSSTESGLYQEVFNVGDDIVNLFLYILKPINGNNIPFVVNLISKIGSRKIYCSIINNYVEDEKANINLNYYKL